MKIDIVQAKIEQKPILANLLELYAYDFTEFWDFDIGTDGYYGYIHLPLYWTDPNRYPYLIYVNDKLAGFVLIQKGFSLLAEENINSWDVTEFFIMRKYRRKNVGSFVALDLWNRLQGSWQVKVLFENKRAQAFWSQAIHRFAKKSIIPLETKIQKELWLIYRFESK